MSVFSPVVGVLLKTVTAYYYSLHVRTVYTSSLRVLYVYMCMHVRDEEGSVYISLHHESLVNSAVMHNLSDRFAKLTPPPPPLSVLPAHRPLGEGAVNLPPPQASARLPKENHCINSSITLAVHVILWTRRV